MYGHRHPLAFQASQGEKWVGKFTGKQAIWLIIGGVLSFKMMQLVPNLPLESFVFKHLHHMLPLAVCAVFGFVKEGKTGLPLFNYLLLWVKFHRRPRTLVYKRGG